MTMSSGLYRWAKYTINVKRLQSRIALCEDSKTWPPACGQAEPHHCTSNSMLLLNFVLCLFFFINPSIRCLKCLHPVFLPSFPLNLNQHVSSRTLFHLFTLTPLISPFFAPPLFHSSLMFPLLFFPSPLLEFPCSSPNPWLVGHSFHSTPSVSFAPLYLACSFGDASPLSTASTLEHIAPSACRPRPLVRQQSLQQPLTPRPPPPPNDPPATSQSLGQLHSSSGGGGGQRGGARPGARGSPAAPGASRYKASAGARSRSNPGSWDYMMGQIRTRGMDVKSFLWVLDLKSFF